MRGLFLFGIMRHMNTSEKKSPADSANVLKSEHLNADVRPIIACVGTWKDFYDEKGSIVEKIFEKPAKNTDIVENVDYYGDYKSPTEYKTAGGWSYVISPINDKDKMSSAYKDCTGVAISGVDKETGNNISFLSHQDPEYFLAGGKMEDEFFKDLQERTTELKEKCVPGTIDAVIFGGKYKLDKKNSAEEYRRNYRDSIDFLSSAIFKILGFVPTVVAGPKTDESDNVYFDNKNRRLYLVRPKVGNSTDESYLPKDMEEQEKKWNNDAGLKGFG